MYIASKLEDFIYKLEENLFHVLLQKYFKLCGEADCLEPLTVLAPFSIADIFRGTGAAPHVLRHYGQPTSFPPLHDTDCRNQVLQKNEESSSLRISHIFEHV